LWDVSNGLERLLVADRIVGGCASIVANIAWVTFRGLKDRAQGTLRIISGGDMNKSGVSLSVTIAGVADKRGAVRRSLGSYINDGARKCMMEKEACNQGARQSTMGLHFTKKVA